MRLILNHLRRHILEGAAKRISLLAVIRLYAPTKITNFDDVAFLDENVFWFDISVNQPLFVHEVDAGTDLDEEVKCCVFAQELLFADQVE